MLLDASSTSQTSSFAQFLFLFQQQDMMAFFVLLNDHSQYVQARFWGWIPRPPRKRFGSGGTCQHTTAMLSTGTPYAMTFTAGNAHRLSADLLRLEVSSQVLVLVDLNVGDGADHLLQAGQVLDFGVAGVLQNRAPGSEDKQACPPPPFNMPHKWSAAQNVGNASKGSGASGHTHHCCLFCHQEVNWNRPAKLCRHKSSCDFGHRGALLLLHCTNNRRDSDRAPIVLLKTGQKWTDGSAANDDDDGGATTHHVKCHLWQVIVLALNHTLEASNGCLDVHVLSGRASEHLSDLRAGKSPRSILPGSWTIMHMLSWALERALMRYMCTGRMQQCRTYVLLTAQ
eukprot:1149962-Pelagomonas_calceolata.AAC.3